MFVFLKMWRALFSWNTRFEISLLPYYQRINLELIYDFPLYRSNSVTVKSFSVPRGSFCLSMFNLTIGTRHWRINKIISVYWGSERNLNVIQCFHLSNSSTLCYNVPYDLIMYLIIFSKTVNCGALRDLLPFVQF